MGTSGNRDCQRASRSALKELIPVFHNLHRKWRPSPSAVARTLGYRLGVPSKTASSGKGKKQIRINSQNTHEYQVLRR